ncbi:uncharacterized protein LOC131161526 [Malania oleifera]|uniref:uncharacterized protein LOC131161526 n=1 Tax=Malania oleifera TaxID=397392 RepID=UPI0025ADA494|nr:uncharacterized protein LOC131161526 [Malania oleifera]
MKMEVMIPTQPMNFDFNGARALPSPFLSAPSTPKRFGEFYLSAPTSPTRLSDFYRDFDEFSMNSGSRRGGTPSAIPFDWEETPGTPKFTVAADIDDEFAFEFSEASEGASRSAEELFDGGKIRPLKPPPRLQIGGKNERATRRSPASSPRSLRSPLSHGKKIIRDAFSPKQKKDFDPFAAAVENTRKRTEHERGREKVPTSSSPGSGRRGARSLSPFRDSENPWEDEVLLKNTNQSPMNSKASSSSTTTAAATPLMSSKGYKKWKLKDFLLFRSASEGRATDKDPLKKYTTLLKKHEDGKNSSFRSTDSSGSGSSSRRRGPVSAHELHYTANRAVSADLKKKTFLPYKQGILGLLPFNSATRK